MRQLRWVKNQWKEMAMSKKPLRRYEKKGDNRQRWGTRQIEEHWHKDQVFEQRGFWQY